MDQRPSLSERSVGRIAIVFLLQLYTSISLEDFLFWTPSGRKLGLQASSRVLLRCSPRRLPSVLVCKYRIASRFRFLTNSVPRRGRTSSRNPLEFTTFFTASTSRDRLSVFFYQPSMHAHVPRALAMDLIRFSSTSKITGNVRAIVLTRARPPGPCRSDTDRSTRITSNDSAFKTIQSNRESRLAFEIDLRPQVLRQTRPDKPLDLRIVLDQENLDFLWHVAPR